MQEEKQSRRSSIRDSISLEVKPLTQTTIISQKVRDVMSSVFQKLDFFKATTSFCFEGKPVSASMFGGVITLIVCLCSLVIAGWPFKSSYISSVDLPDNVVYLYTGEKHPIVLNVTLPPGSPPLLGNVSFELGCQSSMTDSVLYQFKTYALPCQLGDYCTPPNLQCQIQTSLNKETSAVMFSMRLCSNSSTPGCNTSFVESLEYINITVSYYSDEVSFQEPVFNRHLLSRQVSVPTGQSVIIEEEMEISLFQTNTYLKGMFAFSPRQLSSLRYPSSSTTTTYQPSFMGLSQGDSLFSYALTTRQSSKRITHNFPNISAWIAQVISFTSIITIMIGFLFGYYETNIMLLRLMSYLRYSVEKDGSVTDFKQSSFKTVLAGLLYHDRIKSCLPSRLNHYFQNGYLKNHFNALREGYRIIRLEYVLNKISKMSLSENKRYKVDLDQEDEGDALERHQRDLEWREIEERLRGFVAGEKRNWSGGIELEVFLSFVQVQNYNVEQSKASFQVLFGRQSITKHPEFDRLREQYFIFRERAFPHYPLPARLTTQQDIRCLELESVGNSSKVMEIHISPPNQQIQSES